MTIDKRAKLLLLCGDFIKRECSTCTTHLVNGKTACTPGNVHIDKWWVCGLWNPRKEYEGCVSLREGDYNRLMETDEYS